MEKILHLILDKLDGLDQKITRVDNCFTSLEQTVAKMDERLTSLEQTVAKMDNRLTSLEQTVAKMDNRLTSLEQQVSANTSEIQRQGDLIHQLIETVAATNVKISETNERIALLEIKVDVIVEDVKDIRENMATQRDLEYYDQMISEHSRQIYKIRNQ